MEPLVLLIICCAVILFGLLHVFFGYKLARFLLPLCGTLLAEFVLYILVYDQLTLNSTETLIFFVGCGAAVYLLLFFIPRIAAFFTGFVGSALVLVFAAYVFNLHGTSVLYPAAMALCVLCGLLAAVYKRVGVIITAALFGGCISSFTGVYLYIEGAKTSVFETAGSIFVPLEYFLTENAFLIGGAAMALALLGIAVQLARTADRQLLEGRLLFAKRGKRKDDMAITI